MRAISDTVTMAGRMMKHTTRSVDTIITVVIMPVLMMLAFVYIFGGAMQMPSSDYKGFIVPGILLFCIASGVSYTSYRLNNDVTSGVFERFRSMPIARSAVLDGHVVTSVVFNMISLFLVMAIAILIGFRPKAGPAQWLIAVSVLLVFTVAMSWMAVFFGLLSKNAETASVFTYPLMALIFTSSSFAPTATMPAGLRAFADHQPLTPIIDATRSLLSDGRVTTDLWWALAWCALLWIVFQALSAAVFNRTAR
jgi:ABC-2 type transport system permease protein